MTLNAKIKINPDKKELNGLYKSLELSVDKMEPLPNKVSRTLFDVKSLATIAVWYFFSFLALFLSKHVIDFHSIDLFLFTGIQLMISTILSFFNQHLYTPTATTEKPVFTHNFIFSMALIGLMRAMVIYMGLVSIKWVALSFMETVKSSAPLFTLIISFLILNEKSGCLVQISIIPIMCGLLLCTAFEVSFKWPGFLAALAANLAECLQFVLSKIYLGGNIHKLDPSDFQFYSSTAGLITIFPFSSYLCDIVSIIDNTSLNSVIFMVIVGVSYYLQTLMAWYLMEILSTVTHSICNTIKCGMAVWLSIVFFGNEITLWSGVGSCMVIAGVVMYQKASSVEKEMRSRTRERNCSVGDNGDVLIDINNTSVTGFVDGERFKSTDGTIKSRDELNNSNMTLPEASKVSLKPSLTSSQPSVTSSLTLSSSSYSQLSSSLFIHSLPSNQLKLFPSRPPPLSSSQPPSSSSLNPLSSSQPTSLSSLNPPSSSPQPPSQPHVPYSIKTFLTRHNPEFQTTLNHS